MTDICPNCKTKFNDIGTTFGIKSILSCPNCSIFGKKYLKKRKLKYIQGHNVYDLTIDTYKRIR